MTRGLLWGCCRSHDTAGQFFETGLGKLQVDDAVVLVIAIRHYDEVLMRAMKERSKFPVERKTGDFQIKDLKSA